MNYLYTGPGSISSLYKLKWVRLPGRCGLLLMTPLKTWLSASIEDIVAGLI